MSLENTCNKGKPNGYVPLDRNGKVLTQYMGYGHSGASGYSGAGGESGFSGYSGSGGESGFSGYSGTKGESGFSGYSGTKGESGFSGYSGTKGESGFSGYSGTKGESGFSGYSGVSGYSGIGKGFSGFSGYSGKCGYSGISGYSGIKMGLPIKTPDQTISNNTLTADDDLVYTMENGKTYYFEILVYVDNGAKDFQWDINFTGTKSQYRCFSWDYSFGLTTPSTVKTSTTINEATTLLLSGGDNWVINIHGIITTTSTGTFQFRFANALTGTASVVNNLGSYMIIHSTT